MAHIVSFLPNVDSQLVQKMQELKYPLSTGNDMLCYDERHTILLDCVMIFIVCVRKVGGASDSIYKPLMVHTMSLLPNVAFQLTHKI